MSQKASLSYPCELCLARCYDPSKCLALREWKEQYLLDWGVELVDTLKLREQWDKDQLVKFKLREKGII